MNNNQYKEIAKMLNDKLTDDQKADLATLNKWKTESIDTKGPKRLEDESFENYKVRRKNEKRLSEIYLKGTLVPEA